MPTYITIYECPLDANRVTVDTNDVAVGPNIKTMTVLKNNIVDIRLSNASPSFVEVIMHGTSNYTLCAIGAYSGQEGVYPVSKVNNIDMTDNELMLEELIKVCKKV